MVLESKPRAVKRPQQKICSNCKQSKPIKEFYSNKDNKQHYGVDCWCKQCACKVKTKDDVRRYYWQNHKKWTEPNWTKAQSKAQAALIVTPLYNDASDARRKVLLDQVTAQNMREFYGQNYEFEKHKETYEEAKAAGKIVNDDPDKRVWDDDFQGLFTAREIKYLKNYYERLLDDFSFEDANTQDFARKMCRASLTYNKAQDDYAAGRCDLSTVKDAMSIFDTLSKSANFAACRRKPGDVSGMTSMSEITLYLETHGYLKTNENEFDEDTIDRVTANYRHLPVALGLDENI